jgi:hypothetical protein
MAGVKAMKWNLVKMIGVAGVALTLAGCPELALKGTIRGLASPRNPGSVHVRSGGDRLFKVTWVDPADPDVASIELDFSTPFATKAPPAPVSVPLGVQKATVSVPLNNVWYFVTVKAVDKAGNKSAGVTPVDIVNFSLPYTTGLKKYQYSYTVPLPGSISYSYSYVYDTNGNLTQENSFNGNLATQYSEYDYTYDSNGNMLSQSYYPYSAGVKQALSSSTTYAYDSNGNLTLQQYYSGTTLSQQYTYEYDASGNMTRQSYYSPPTTLYSYNTYVYDASGHMVSSNYVYPANTANNTSTTYQWDPTTHFVSQLSYTSGSSTVSELITFSAGTLTVSVGSGSGSNALKFDANGLETEEDQLDGSSALTHSTVNQYDITGRQIDSVSYSWSSNVSTATSHSSWSY